MHLSGNRKIFTTVLAGVLLLILFVGYSQVTAAPIQGSSLLLKLTPSPTFDPVLYQEDNTPITAASIILVLIIFFALIFVLFRRREEI